jgi:hypothetical protein
LIRTLSLDALSCSLISHSFIRLFVSISMRSELLFSVCLAGLTAAHGSHSQKIVVPDNADWMTKHMAGMPYEVP